MKLTFGGAVDCSRWFWETVWFPCRTSSGGRRGKTCAIIGLKHRPKRRAKIAHNRKVFSLRSCTKKTIVLLAELSKHWRREL